MSYGGVPFPGSQSPYVNPNAPSYGAPPGAGYGAPPPGAGYGAPPSAGGFHVGSIPSAMPTAPAADPYANAQPGTIAYAKSEGPDGIATYTPVIAQGDRNILGRDQPDRLTV